ncbi:4-vinyl reductase 4VR [Hydrogenobacter thermophilus TK-6]|nr:V4R domain-containing protein [Hydrogenobacter thermophilus]ADO45604.1 4-vinyl reductase 4VR [Hydrogenobacter thermophilus TK-6]
MDELEAVSKIRVFLKDEGFIVPKKPVQEFYSSIIKLSGFGVGGILNMSGRKAGNIAGQIIKELIGNHEPSIEEIELYLRVFLSEAGICEITRWENQEKQVKIYAKNSVFAEEQESSKPVCIPLQGALAGCFEELTGKEWDCKETQCQAQKKEECIFELWFYHRSSFSYEQTQDRSCGGG